MLERSEHSAVSDGGAPIAASSADASFPTYLLTHWTRDRTPTNLSIPFVVAAQSRKTALSVGLGDRSVIAPGYKADINVIDYDQAASAPPKVHPICGVRPPPAAAGLQRLSSPPLSPAW